MTQDYRASDAADDNDVVPMEIDDADAQGGVAASETAMIEESTTIFVVGSSKTSSSSHSMCIYISRQTGGWMTMTAVRLCAGRHKCCDIRDRGFESHLERP